MFTKYASATIMGYADSPKGKTASMKTCGSFEYEPRSDHQYLYVAARACTADVPNLNYDMLPDKELKTAYKTFIGSYVYLNHDNTDPRKARGAIIDAKYHTEDENDKWVEILMELDEEKAPKLCSLIRSGDIDTVSMGCSVANTECSVCGNIAEYPFEYCTHIQDKGREYQGKLAFEICNGIEFFEESFVYNPADPTAYVKGLNEETVTAKKSAKHQNIVVKNAEEKPNRKAASKKTSELNIWRLLDDIEQNGASRFSDDELIELNEQFKDAWYNAYMADWWSQVCEEQDKLEPAWKIVKKEMESRGLLTKQSSIKTASILDIPLSECSADDFELGAVVCDYQDWTVCDWFYAFDGSDGTEKEYPVKVIYEWQPVYFRGITLGYIGGAYNPDEADNIDWDKIEQYNNYDITWDEYGPRGTGSEWLEVVGQEIRTLDSVFFDTFDPNDWDDDATLRDLIEYEMEEEPFELDEDVKHTASKKVAQVSSNMRTRLSDYVRDCYGNQYIFGCGDDGHWSITGDDGFYVDKQSFKSARGFVNYAKEIDSVMTRYSIKKLNGWNSKEPYLSMKWATFASDPKRPNEVNAEEDSRICPLCGSESFDGDFCSICGYQEPPEGFGDIEIDDDDEVKDVEEETEEKDDKKEEKTSSMDMEIMYDISDDPRYFINVAEEAGGDYTLIGFEIIKTDDIYVQDALEDAGAIEM